MIDLFILSGTFSNGGAEKVAATLGNELPSTISRKLISLHRVVNSYNTNDEVITLSSTSPNITVLRLIKFPMLTLRYIRLLHRYHPKVSLSILLEDDLINVFSSIVTKCTPIVSFHWMPNRKMSATHKLLQQLLIKYIIQKNIKTVAVSHGVKEALILFGIPSENISVIYNPIDIQSIVRLSNETVEKSLFTPIIPTIITVGRLTEVKGQWHLIRVFAELRKTMFCRLIICGDGPLRRYLKNLATELNVQHDVIFMGWCDNPYKYVKHSDVFVLTSLSEALPSVIIESMAVGCPVIATNCSGGIEEIFGSDNDFGVIVSKQTSKKDSDGDSLDMEEVDLMENIRQMLSNQKIRSTYSKNGFERASRFSLEQSVKEYTSLITSVYL